MIVIGHKDGIIEKKSNIHATQIVKGYPTYTIIGGEFAVTSDADNVAFKTLLGSCVAMMFYDNVKKVKGMNHFLLPCTESGGCDMKYGLYSVEAMLNEMYKMGCSKENIRAKIAGGAHILKSHDNRIGDKNVDFALSFCKSEGIKVSSDHVRGDHGRVVLLTTEFETFVRTVQNRSVEEQISKEEDQLTKTLTSESVQPEATGGIDLF